MKPNNVIEYAVEQGCSREHLVQLLALDMHISTMASYEYCKGFVIFALNMRDLQSEIKNGRD